MVSMNNSYRERDYTFGQIILTLRNKLKMTQSQLGDNIGISGRSVSEWETGNSYPKAERLKAFIALAVQHQAFVGGSEAEEIRALWKAARQKVLLDEHWLSTLLDKQAQELDVAPAPVLETVNHTSATTLPAFETREKSDDAPAIPLLPKRKGAKAPQTPGRHKRLVGIVLTLVILAITGTGAILLLQIIPTQTHSYPEYLSGNSQLSFFDPLSQESGSQWSSQSNNSGGTCRFTHGAYHISQQLTGSLASCSAHKIFSNFTFEVQLTITRGDCGGMVFRDDNAGHFYYFHICEDGIYAVLKYVDPIHAKYLYSGRSSAFHTGLGQQNKIAVVANGSLMTFYVNEQQIDQEQDSSYTSGKIALIAAPYSSGGHATDVAYSNARLCRL
jgi:transcriptional regulator with XRE-family HTH domain